MLRIAKIALHTIRQNLFDPLLLFSVVIFVGGQEIGWRLGDLSIDSPQSVSLSVIHAIMHLIGGIVAISIGCRLWQRNRFDQSFELELIAPSGFTQAYIGKVFGLFATILLFLGICIGFAWLPTLAPVPEMRLAFVLIGFELFILASSAACFAAVFGPLIAALFAGVFWICSLALPLVIGNLVHKYAPARNFLESLTNLISLQRLQVFDPYALGEGAVASVDWSQLGCYTAASGGVFLTLGYLLILRRRYSRG